MKKILIFLIVNFFLINNVLAEKNYLYCIETLDKARDHFMNEGDIESAAFIEYDDIKKHSGNMINFVVLNFCGLRIRNYSQFFTEKK